MVSPALWAAAHGFISYGPRKIVACCRLWRRTTESQGLFAALKACSRCTEHENVPFQTFVSRENFAVALYDTNSVVNGFGLCRARSLCHCCFTLLKRKLLPLHGFLHWQPTNWYDTIGITLANWGCLNST